MNKRYTIIGYYEDTDQPFNDHIEAANPMEAAREVILRHPEPGDLIVVDILEGWHMSQISDQKRCIPACDVPGVEHCDCW